MAAPNPSADEITEAFRFFDADNDGKLNRDEFIKCVQALGQTPTLSEAHGIMDAAGLPGKSVSTKGETIYDMKTPMIELSHANSMMPSVIKTFKSKADVITAFKRFEDLKKEGHVKYTGQTPTGLIQILTQYGDQLPGEIAEEARKIASEVAASDSEEHFVIEKFVEWMKSA